MIRQSAHDVVLLDLSLPGKSGLDVLKYVKEQFPSTKVIVLTGFAGLPVAIECVKLGASDYITKPCRVDYLIASINRMIETESGLNGYRLHQ